MSAYTNSVWLKLIFPTSSSTLGEGGGCVAARLFGQRQLLVYCRHHLSTLSRLCIDISCKLYSQQLVKWRRARLSHDWQLTSGEGCCCPLTGCYTIIRLWRCPPLSTRRRAVWDRNMPNTTRWHSLCYRHDHDDIHYYLYNYAWPIFLIDSLNDLQCKTCLISAMWNKLHD